MPGQSKYTVAWGTFVQRFQENLRRGCILIVGGDGVIGGPANVSRRSCVKVMALYKAGQVAEARELQAIVSRGDWIAIKGSFVALCALQMFNGYWQGAGGKGGLPRKPVPFPGRRA